LEQRRCLVVGKVADLTRAFQKEPGADGATFLAVDVGSV
jgi:hypothetical protein